MILNIDLHVHTEYSLDGTVSIDKVVEIAKRRGLNGIAITDHNTIEGALKLKNNIPKDFILIIGEEINTLEGEITGFFLKESIPPGLPSEETIERIKLQGGLVSLPHPFCRFRKNKLKLNSINRIIKLIDIIEVYNSRNIFQIDNKKAFELAKNNAKLMIVGSDAHIGYEYGQSFIRILPFKNTDEFQKNLSSSEFVCKKSPVWAHLITKLNKIKFVLNFKVLFNFSD